MLAASAYYLMVLNTESMALSVVAVGLFILAFAAHLLTKRTNSKPETLNLKNSADVLYNGAAGLQQDDSQLNGTLYLLRDKLIFRAGSFSKVKHETIIGLSDIREVSFAKTHRVHEKIVVIMTENTQHRFLVKANQLWIDEIENALMHNSLVTKGCAGKAV